MTMCIEAQHVLIITWNTRSPAGTVTDFASYKLALIGTVDSSQVANS
jgi:hypothetical protein